MKKLLTVNPASPVTFTNVVGAANGLTGHVNWLPDGASHTVIVNEEKGYAVAAGARPRTGPCRAGLMFIDLSDPSKPKDMGCAAQDGYVHDVSIYGAYLQIHNSIIRRTQLTCGFRLNALYTVDQILNTTAKISAMVTMKTHLPSTM